MFCSVLHNDGNIISSIMDESIDKSVEIKIINLYNAIHSFSSNFYDYPNIETCSFFKETDIKLKGFIMITTSILDHISLIVIIPSWLEITNILIEFKKLVNKLTKFFNVNKINEDYVECKLIL